MIREQLLRAFEMVEQKETTDRAANVRRHISHIIEDLTKNRSLSRKSRDAKVDADTVRRWAREGINSLSEQLESFVSSCGYDPSSVFEAKLRPISKRETKDFPEQPRASKVASKILDASRSNRLTDDDLQIIESMIDRLSRS